MMLNIHDLLLDLIQVSTIELQKITEYVGYSREIVCVYPRSNFPILCKPLEVKLTTSTGGNCI